MTTKGWSRPPKVAIIGAASSNFGPGLLHAMEGNDLLADGTLVLVDRDERRLAQVTDLTRAVCAELGLSCKVTATTDRREAIVGADFVLIAIAVGGLEAWESDIELPGKYGVFMRVADTVGPGGFFRAMRHAPVLHEIACDVRELAPRAWVLSYTNPEGVCTMAMLASGHRRTASLCTCVCDLAPNLLAAGAGVEPDELALPPIVAGINHCAGIVDLCTTEGESVFDALKQSDQRPRGRFFIERYGVVPYCLEHWFEFHPPLSQIDDDYQGRAQGLRLKEGGEVRDMEQQRARVGRWTSALEGASTLRTAAGGDSARATLPPEDPGKPIQMLDLVASVVRNEGRMFVANIRNDGAIPNLAHDAIVECAVRADAYGLRAVAVPALSEAFVAKLEPHIAAQRLTCTAALSGKREDARLAFCNDPVVDALLDPDDALALFEEMYEANAPYLRHA